MAACSATSPLSVSGSSGHRQLRSESEQKEIDEFEEEERKIMSQQDSQVSTLTYQIVVAYQISIALGIFSEIHNPSPLAHQINVALGKS